MRFVLANVPHCPPFSPQLGLSIVATELRERGHSVEVLDLNLDAFDFLFESAFANGTAVLRSRLANLEGRAALSRQTAREYVAIAGQLARAPTPEMITAAVACLRGGTASGDFADWGAYDRSLSTLERALEVTSAPFAPERATLATYTPPFPIRCEADLSAYARIPTTRAVFGNTMKVHGPLRILAAFADAAPDAVGISISWPGQLGPAAMLGKALREAGFDGAIVWGGALIPHLADDLAACDELVRTSLVDAFVRDGGGAALESYCRWRSGERGWWHGGLIMSDGAQPPADPDASASGVEELRSPGFEGLPLDRYLSPRSVLPILTTLGCYYRRCAFCSHFHSQGAHRRRPVASVMAEMQSLHAATGCRDYYIVDDCTPPRTLLELSGAILDWRQSGGPHIGWITECRVERALLDEGLLQQISASGCRMLLLGMESASDDVLAAMAKGFDSSLLREVIAAIHRAGIGIWCFLMHGFPGEKADDARRTREFLADHGDEIDVIADGPFVLTRHCQVASRPGLFGVRIGRSQGPSRSRRRTRAAPTPGRAWLESTHEHDDDHGSARSAAHWQRQLRDDPRLQHYLHPLVVEAHALFLPRAYYHRGRPDDPGRRPRAPGASVSAILARSVRLLPGVQVMFFRFPTLESHLPPRGKVPPRAGAIISRAGIDSVHASVRIGRLVERCRRPQMTVAEIAGEMEEEGLGSPTDIVRAIVELAEQGILRLDPGSPGA